MTVEISILTTTFIFNATVNYYLVRTGDKFVLIDTGTANKRNTIEKELENAGCKPGNLALIVLTHGDFDHSDNAAYLRNKFGTPIAMHKVDSGMVEHGDMLWNRNKQYLLIRIMFKLFFRLSESDRFKPDFYIDEGYNFSKYGFDAKVLAIPGHSKGSIGILTTNGDLFCGDLLVNTDKPAKNTIIDDLDELNASVEKLKRFQINTVYPSHGQPFPMELFIKN
ncbi:MAG: MBL fold metallo-hydrolase [Candidatus Methylarchaceae archaeon HK02M2]|nr:MBL fold metallo-hydrolase [Candidatus Methylarchaceae archaeon HK02M2]